MRKLITVILILTFGIMQCAFGESVNVKTSTSVTINNIFSVEFFNDNSVRYPTGAVAFPAYDPSTGKTMLFTSAYSQNDNKSDVGVIVRTNKNSNWYLKIGISGYSGTFQPTNLAIYYPEYIYDRNDASGNTKYASATGKGWKVSQSIQQNGTGGTTVFNGTGTHQNTAPFGYLATFSFAILPTGQADLDGNGTPDIGTKNILSEGTHNFDILYVLTETL